MKLRASLFLILPLIVIFSPGPIALAAALAAAQNATAAFQAYGQSFPIPLVGKEQLTKLPGTAPRTEKKNKAFYESYLRPAAEQISKLELSPREKIAAYAGYVIAVHEANGIGYVWGGDMADGDPDPASEGGVGYDCSGFVWSVYAAIAPDSVFTDPHFRINAKDYLELGREIAPPRKVGADFWRAAGANAKPGDVLINPDGHIALVAEEARGGPKIVLENGYQKLTTEAWSKKYLGDTFAIRSAFDEKDVLISGANNRFPGRIAGVFEADIDGIKAILPKFPQYIRRFLKNNLEWKAKTPDLDTLYLGAIVSQFPDSAKAQRALRETYLRNGINPG